MIDQANKVLANLVPCRKYANAAIVSPIDNPYGRGLMVFVNIGQIANNSLTVSIEVLEPFTGTFHPLLVSKPLTAPGLTVLTVYPGVNEIEGLKANSPIGKQVYVRLVHDNLQVIEYNVAATLLI